MAGNGLALMQFLGMGNMLGQGMSMHPMGRAGGYQEDTYTQQVQTSKDGKSASVTFNTMDPTPMGALARENFRRLGMDSPMVGRRQISLNARVDGDKLVFDIGGKERSVTQEALQNARGLELQRLLGVQSFMDFAAAKNNAANNAAYSKSGLQQPQLRQTRDQSQGTSTTATNTPAGAGTGANAQTGPRPDNAPVGVTGQQVLMPIPTMQAQPFAAMQPAINPYAAMAPAIPGYGIGGQAGPGGAGAMRFGDPNYGGTQFGYYGFADGSAITPPTNSGYSY